MVKHISKIERKCLVKIINFKEDKRKVTFWTNENANNIH